jgi:dihydroorotate dehydrogenase electron transfer subunit
MIHNATTCIAELVSKREVIPGTFHFVLKAPVLARESRPGQFVMIRVQDGTDPLLRRPISLCGACGDAVELLFQVRGRGTELMAAWEPGRSVSLMGPLGNTFIIPDAIRTAVLVAGGIGAAPLLYLAKTLAGLPDVHRTFFFGSKTAKERALVEVVPLDEFFEYVCVAEDGAGKIQGFVTDAFSVELVRKKINAEGACIYSCGPSPMLKKVAQISADYSIPCQLSLEAHMACGVGACLGCVVETREGYKRVCADGPVFDSSVLGLNHDS